MPSGYKSPPKAVRSVSDEHHRFMFPTYTGAALIPLKDLCQYAHHLLNL